MREFKEDRLPKKSLLSLQIDLNKFSPATDEEKQQHETMRESTTFSATACASSSKTRLPWPA